MPRCIPRLLLVFGIAAQLHCGEPNAETVRTTGIPAGAHRKPEPVRLTWDEQLRGLTDPIDPLRESPPRLWDNEDNSDAYGLEPHKPWSPEAPGSRIGPILPGPFSMVSAGTYHTCALRVDGSARCWGANWAGQSTPAAGPFVQIAAGFDHSCGLRADGTLACWGDNRHGQLDLGATGITQIAAGFERTCAILKDGAIVCRGHRDYRSPEGLKFAKVRVYQPCVRAITSAGELVSLVCERDEDDGAILRSTAIKNVTAFSEPCILTTEQGVRCDYKGYPERPFRTLDGDRNATCGIGLDGTLACWGGREFGVDEPPPGEFTSVTVGEAHACGLTRQGAIQCWGFNAQGQTGAPPLELELVALDASRGTVRAREADGFLWLWGSRTPSVARSRSRYELVTAWNDAECICGMSDRHELNCCDKSLPTGRYTALALSGQPRDQQQHGPRAWAGTACGIDANGKIQCEDVAADLRSAHVGPPSGRFSVLTGGDGSFCASGQSGVRCWRQANSAAWNGEGFTRPRRAQRLSAPQGEHFAAMAIGGICICGLRGNGTVRCWKNSNAVCKAPDCCQAEMARGDRFTAISAGDLHACGLTTQGELRCWGSNDYGESRAPEGHFTSLVSALNYNCARRTDGEIVCWGLVFPRQVIYSE